MRKVWPAVTFLALLLVGSVGRGNTGSADIPPNTWVAIKDPTDPTLFYTEKHTTVAYSPPLKRFYLTGGDTRKNVLGPGGVGLGSVSYQQLTISFDLNARLSAPGQVNVGWRLEQPWCASPPAPQPKYPDFIGFAWVPWLSKFATVPGEYVGGGGGLHCPGETSSYADDPPHFLRRHIMTFDPATRRWADMSGKHGVVYPGNGYPWHFWPDPVRKRFIRIEYGMIDEYDLTTDSWGYFRTALFGSNIDDAKSFLAVDEAKRKLYTADRCNHKWYVYDLDPRAGRAMGPLPGSPYAGQGMSVCSDKAYLWFVPQARKVVYAEIVPRDTTGFRGYRIWAWAIDDPRATWQRIDPLPQMTLDGEPLPGGEKPHATTGAVDTDTGILFLTGEYGGFATNSYSWIIRLAP